MKYRSLTAEEVALLNGQGNRAEDWSKVQVKDGFDAACVYGTCFCGQVYSRDSRADKNE